MAEEGGTAAATAIPQPGAIDLRANLCIAGAILCWASVPVFLRALAHSIDAWTANGLRYPLAAVLYWPILLAAWRSGRLDPGLWRRALIPAGVTFAGQILWALAPYYLEAPLIAFLGQTSVIWGIVGAMVLFPDERTLLRSPRFYAGLVLAALGAASLAISRGVLEGKGARVGVLIMLACGFFFGLYAVSVRRCMRRDSPLLAFGVVAQYVSLGTVGLMLLFAPAAPLARFDLKGWGVMAASSVLGIAVAHVLLYTAVQRLGAALAHGVSLAKPFLTLVLAYLVLGETLTPTQVAAGVAMVAGGAILLSSQLAGRLPYLPPNPASK